MGMLVIELDGYFVEVYFSNLHCYRTLQNLKIDYVINIQKVAETSTSNG